MPLGKPAIQLWAQDEGDPGAVCARVATKNDSSADVTAYELVHQIHMLGLTETFDNASQLRYYLVFYGETSTNSLIGLSLVDVSVLVVPQ